jgi:integrase
LVDWQLLGRLGWDAEREVFAPAADDPAFGFAVCKVVACDQVTRGRNGLCRRCERHWRRAGPGADLEQFCQTAPARSKNRGGALCRVCRAPGHGRPARHRGLCLSCATAMLERGQTVEGYVHGDEHFGPAAPRPSFGRCGVPGCPRWAELRRPPLCEPHDRAWRLDGRPEGAAFAPWCSRQRVLEDCPRVVVLGGLAERAQLEVLYSLQRASETERRTRTEEVQRVVNAVRAQGASSLFGLRTESLQRHRRLFVAFTCDQVMLGLATPSSEAAKDDWDLRVFGHSGGFLHFGRISQGWLKEAAKQWAAERASTVETARVLGHVLRSLGTLSESLRRQRDDHGTDPRLLSRADMSAFSNDLAHLEAAGKVSRFTRRHWLLQVDQFLREARAMGLSRPGGPLAGLPDDVVLHPRDRVRAVSLDEQGRALPQTVVDQLLAPEALRLLEGRHGPDVRAMVELQAQVGRRTGELCHLRWDCLAFDEVVDEAGQVRAAPVLVHDMPKVAVHGYHLPIGDDTAEVIRAQQARVRARFPATPTSQLALFPRFQKNPRGAKPYNQVTFAKWFRSWVDSLPEIVGPGGEPYDRSGLTPYSFRHSYAQRHADSGTPIEVVAVLMGHTNLVTTGIYYRVNEERKRKAVDLLAALQVGRDGNQTRPAVERLLESEALRDAVGQVAVPFGICREPTNVKAQGQACPFRHQCFGCEHFRSDPSFLPELRGHLNRLLADRERLRAAVPELEEWARNAAVPAKEEVAAVRRVIDRCQAMLADLPEAERAEAEEAIATLRRARAQLDTSVPVRFRGRARQPSPTLFPNLRRQRKKGADDAE